MADAGFMDGGESPLNLGAADGDDLQILSALVQDAVLVAGDIRWQKDQRRLALLINRFRWENRDIAEGRAPAERVRALLIFDDVMAVESDGISPDDPDLVLSLLTLEWQPGEDGTGRIGLIFSGDGEIRLEVESINLMLRDVTQPYKAPSGKGPRHP